MSRADCHQLNMLNLVNTWEHINENKIGNLPIPWRQLGLDQHVNVSKVNGDLRAITLDANKRSKWQLSYRHEQEEQHPGLGPQLTQSPRVGVQGVVLDAYQQGTDNSECHQGEQREHLAVLLQCPATHGP